MIEKLAEFPSKNKNFARLIEVGMKETVIIYSKFAIFKTFSDELESLQSVKLTFS